MTPEELVKTKLYRLLLQVAYMERGVNKMSYLRYSVFGVFMADLESGFWYMLLFGLLGYIIGRVWFKKGLVFLDAEIGNQFNKFQQELRVFSKKDTLIK